MAILTQNAYNIHLTWRPITPKYTIIFSSFGSIKSQYMYILLFSSPGSISSTGTIARQNTPESNIATALGKRRPR